MWRERVEEYVDLQQFMTHVAIEVFLAENDGVLGAEGMNNFYLYRFADTKRHRLLPWDKDNSFLVVDYSIFQRADENVLFRRAFAFADLRELYFQVLEVSRPFGRRGRLARDRGRATGGADRGDGRARHAEAVFDRRVLRVGRVYEAVCTATVEVRAGPGP